MCTIIKKDSLDIATARSPKLFSSRNKTTQNDTVLCRICFDNETTGNPLIRPCSCSGTVAHVHSNCLEQWVKTTANIRCTICQDEFELVPMGLRKWYQCTLPGPISDLSEDVLDFACTIAWIVYMFRFAYIALIYGTNALLVALDDAMGNGTFRGLWWLSFWFNFLYYGSMTCLIYEKWLMENSTFGFKDRSKIRQVLTAQRTARRRRSTRF